MKVWGPFFKEQGKDNIKGTKILSYFLSYAICLSTCQGSFSFAI